MNQRILTGILFALAVSAFVIPGYWWPIVPLILLILVVSLSRTELDRALASRQLGLPPVLSRIGVLLFLLPLLTLLPQVKDLVAPIQLGQTWLGLFLLMAGQIAWAAVMSLTLLILQGPQVMPRAVAAAVSTTYLAFPFGTAVVILMTLEQGWLWLIVALVTPWLSDVLAYFTGYFLGRHKIVPQISPKKTVEGSLGGLVGGMLALGLALPLITGFTYASFFTLPVHWLAVIAGGIVLSTASQLGDWLASGIKRWCDVKDFGAYLPGHGGTLDRFDSVLFTLPFTLLLAIWGQIAGY
ncbi:MAG: hypothetical protein EOM08_06285 [Clostridia bacterium]|nr:hypothetical protein [Clostridia bacterium]